MYHNVILNDIEINPNRQRKNFNEQFIRELADSIAKHGLLNPPICHVKDGTYVLAAGECRIRAMKSLHSSGRDFSHMGVRVNPNECPILYYSELEPIAAKMVELEENLRRTDLTWQERAAAIKEIHDMQTPGATFSQTAQVMQSQYNTTIDPSRVKTMTVLAEYVNHPEVRAARTEKEAIRHMYQVVERELNAKIGARQKITSVDFRFGDAIQQMEIMNAESIDCILTDPPYGIDADKMGLASFNAPGHTYIDDWTAIEPMMESFALESHRICAKQAHLYLFCDIKRFFALSDIFNNRGWVVWPTPLIWSKGRGPIPSPDYGPMRTYECILFANKGKKQVLIPLPDLVYAPLEANRDHAAQKPVEVYANLLKRSVKPSDVVLDPFCGSGTIFLAAKELNVYAIGIDNDPAVAPIIHRRTSAP